MDRVAFVIPIHPPFYHFMHRFLARYPENSSRIYLVFSSPEDRDAFGVHPAVTPIIIPQGLTYSMHSPDGIVDYKKFYALSQLMDTPHDYFIACDAEIHLVVHNFTPENVLFKIDSLFANKRIYYGVGDGEGFGDLNRGNFLSEPELERLKEMTGRRRVHFWWSDLPVYRRDTLKHFFEKFPISDQITSRPDNILYQYYLALYHGFSFIDVNQLFELHCSLEGFATLNEENIHKLTRVGYGHSWVVSTQYKINHRILDELGTFLVYHLDRWTTPDFWDPNRKPYHHAPGYDMPTK
jgi:hypothetical protein